MKHAFVDGNPGVASACRSVCRKSEATKGEIPLRAHATLQGSGEVDGLLNPNIKFLGITLAPRLLR